MKTKATKPTKVTKASRVEVIGDVNTRLKKLEQFFDQVADLTVNHEVLNDHACVFASKLGNALDKVDDRWCYTKR